MKKLIGASVVALLLGGLVLPASAAPKATVAFEDAAGDAGNQDSGVPGVDQAFDLIKGEIVQEKKTEIKFTVTQAAMPASGPPGEAFRFIWGFSANGTQYEWTVKSVDVGEPDVVTTAMTQTPHGEERVGKVYQGVARLEECGFVSVGINWSQCDVVAYYPATFDAASASFSWSADTKTLGVKKGSVITGGGGSRATTGCMICWVPQYAERSLTPHTIIDSAVQINSYKVR